MATGADISTEILDGESLYLAQAAKLIPRHRHDRPVHPSTIYRWVVEGIQLPGGERLKLEATRLAGRYLTTRSALKRFLSAQQPEQSGTAPTLRTPVRRQREHAAATARLAEQYGIG